MSRVVLAKKRESRLDGNAMIATLADDDPIRNGAAGRVQRAVDDRNQSLSRIPDGIFGLTRPSHELLRTIVRATFSDSHRTNSTGVRLLVN